MSKSLHDQIAENLAKKFGTEYKKHKGIDIVTRWQSLKEQGQG